MSTEAERRRIALRAVRSIAEFVEEFDLYADEVACLQKALVIAMRKTGANQ